MVGEKRDLDVNDWYFDFVQQEHDKAISLDDQTTTLGALGGIRALQLLRNFFLKQKTSELQKTNRKKI